MKLLVFGATGGTGQQVVEQALAQGHEVTAFARRPEAVWSPSNAGRGETLGALRILKGDVRDSGAVAEAVKGQDAVISALGTRGDEYGLLPEATRGILAAMQQAGVRRFICVTSYGVGDSKDQMSWLARKLIVDGFLKKAIAEKEVQERFIRESAADWTIVRPGGLTDGPRTGVYHCYTGAEPKIGRPSIARADVADFILKNLMGDEWVKCAVGLTY